MNVRVPGIGRLREAARVRQREQGLRRARPGDVAGAWARAITPVPVPGLEVRPGARRLLVLSKTGGTEDAIATLAGRGDGRGDIGIELVGLDRAEIKHAFRALIGEGHERLRDVDYRPDDEDLAEAKARYREFLGPVMRRLRDEHAIIGVLGANVTYYAERELAGACEDVDLPFLVLHKESIRSPRQREVFTRAYRERTGPFTGRAVAVYNTSERDSQVAGGVVTDAAVVGCPRIDALHAWREVRAAQGVADRAAATGPVVLFAIDPGAGTWTPYDGEEDQGAPRWDELAAGTESALLDLARSHPNHPFVIKAKVGHGERLLARLAEGRSDGLPANVSIVTSGTATELLQRAAVIIAFNTTVIAEGLAAGVPVVVPAFAEAAVPDAEGWRYPVGDAVVRAERPEDLAPAVLAAQATHRRPRATLDGTVAEVLDTLVGNPDGRAGDRAWDWLRHELSLG